MSTKFQSLHEDFTKALLRLDEVLALPKNDVVRDSAIKRFELCFELGWKAMKAYLEENHNVACASPRTCFREAFRVGAIDYDEHWINLTSTRNYTVHTYREAFAEKIYAELPRARDMFHKLADVLKKPL
ncbi:MAG: nucleotidyltransferase substrate binding protein [Parcubacteria group bacterium]|nr:nucleotidyltransferase substrate binding protein [Parcubacteria group bacterium]